MTVATKTAALTRVMNQTVGELEVTQASLDAQIATAQANQAGAQANQATSEGYRDTAATHATGAATQLATIDTNVTLAGIAAIAAAKTEQAVDVFIYDTTLDSDGGAWRDQCQHLSWFSEALNTASRGSRSEFPAVALIVAETAKVTIYDADDPSLPMWMVFNDYIAGSSVGVSTIRAVSALNGEMVVGTNLATNDYQSGLVRVRFAKDIYSINRGSILDDTLVGDGQIVNRSSRSFGAKYAAGQRLLSGFIWDVAMTVLADAPFDQVTGLRVPTIAVATAGGLSVLKDDGTVVSSTSISQVSQVAWDDNNGLIHNRRNSAPALQLTPDIRAVAANWSGAYLFNTFSNPRVGDATTNAGMHLAALKSGFAYAKIGTYVTTDGMGQIQVGTSVSTSMMAMTKSLYSTGWMVGDIKGAFLADTLSGDLVGGVVADRSVNGVDLNVIGTIARTPVAADAELVGYGGFSASNRLEQPHNADMDFGTGDFSVLFWWKTPNLANATPIERGDQTTTVSRWGFYINDGEVKPYINTSILTGAPVMVDQWALYAMVRRSGVLEVYSNGVLRNSIAATGDVSSTPRSLHIGARSAGANHTTGELALIRISANAPTAEQMTKIFEDERMLFQPGAQCTLFGTSDGVTDLARDKQTNLLHVGTVQGRSVFDGLQRIDNTTTAVGTAISAVSGMVAED